MKKLWLSTLAVFILLNFSYAQNTSPLPTGPVGIGTNSPASGLMLDVIGNGSFSGTLSLGVGGAATNIFQQTLAHNYYGISGVSYPGQFRWYASPNNSLYKDNALFQLRSWDAGTNTENTMATFTGGGSFGIGTLSPIAKLDVNGMLNIGVPMNYNAFGSSTLHIGGSGNSALTAPFWVLENSTAFNGITPLLESHIYSDGINNPELAITTGNRPGYLKIQSDLSDLNLFAHDNTIFKNMSGAELMRIAANGNVGVGTASPFAKLDLGNVIGNSPYVQELTYSANDQYFQGIGVNLGQSPNAMSMLIGGYSGASAGPASFEVVSSNNLTWPYTSYQTRFMVLSDGRIGIGTHTPNANLEVNKNTIIGTGGDKFNTALTLIKNGDSYGIDNPVLVIKHSGNGGNSYGNPASDNGIIQITGFNTAVSNKAINSNNNFYVFTNGTVAVNANRVPTGYTFAVGGNAIAEQMTVMLQADWPDYIFKKDYTLMPLSDLKTYIDKNHHLPEIPSAADVEKDGLNLGEMNRLLLKKVEQLTLYLIEQQKVNQSLQQQIDALKTPKN
jgi:hypothetical protein